MSTSTIGFADEWLVEHSGFGEPIEIGPRGWPRAIIIDSRPDGVDVAAAFIRTTRARIDPFADAPLVVIDATPPDGTDWLSDGADQVVTSAATPADLAIWAAPSDATVARLVDVFGQQEIATLLVRFRVLLIDSLDAIRRSTAHASAHQVAGLAGTLGYKALSTQWRAFEDGDADVGHLAQLTRRTIYEIAAYLADTRA